ncbi:MAG: DinB family protein [Bacteroidetes bacterium]|nr:DinB family protein [Bacteroidota bacterium]
MKLIPMLVKEMEHEAATTRKMLTIVPDDKYDWKPHPKSMNMKSLAIHIAELTTWVSMVIHTSELNFGATPYKQEDLKNTKELLAYFEKCLADAKATLEKADEEKLNEIWTLRSGDDILMQATKAETIRHTYCQIVHHRAQLGVYLRLLNIPIPGSYGPSADEMGM